ncbi:hypothetical protein MFUL124B02_21525 [Myxococcus fulvus 124B02]|nr:hypothetical protein MFUL124B02_21525 [Myxococcus fulvus 124B02]
MLMSCSQWACAARTRCGASYCETDETCCNDSCGICTPKGVGCILPYCSEGPGEMCASPHPAANLYNHVDVRAGLAHQKLRPEAAPDISYGGRFAHAELQQKLLSDVMLRGRLSVSRSDSAPALDPGDPGRTAWSAGTGASVALPAPWSFMPSVASLDVEANEGRGFASQLTPTALGDRGIGAVAPALTWWFVPFGKLPLTVHTRYVHTQVNGPGDMGLLESGVSAVPLHALDFPYLRLGYRYGHELTRGSFREHEVGVSAWWQWNFLHVGAEGAARFSRLSPSLSARGLSAALRLEIYWDILDHST